MFQEPARFGYKIFIEAKIFYVLYFHIFFPFRPHNVDLFKNRDFVRQQWNIWTEREVHSGAQPQARCGLRLRAGSAGRLQENYENEPRYPGD